jgi:hypothetical protein
MKTKRSMSLKNIMIAALAATQLGLSAQASTFEEVWTATQEGRYLSLPQHPVTNASFFAAGVNRLKNSVDRTLNNQADVLPYFQKLLHPIGICYAGTWSITEKNPYTGYFAEGSEGLIIARASEALGQPFRGDYRSFGLAGKIFPTTDRNDKQSYKTANFFTVDDLGGTLSKSFLELPKLNEPALSFHLNNLLHFSMFTTVFKTFSAADKNPAIRPVYPIAELGLDDPSSAVVPHWMMIQAVAAPTFSNPPKDFRNELRLHRFPGNKLKFNILVAEKGSQKWLSIGNIELTEDVVSEGCDHRLHFAHPKHR